MTGNWTREHSTAETQETPKGYEASSTCNDKIT
nr:MAG TPA: hypothetical protein [Caudoviricetes sp.]